MNKMRLLSSLLFSLSLFFMFPILGFRNSSMARLPASAGTLHKDGQMTWGGQPRIYYYYEPENPGASPRPLVILLHGGGGNVDSFLGLDGKTAPFKRWREIADRDTLYLAIPQGFHQNHWHDCRGDCEPCGDEDDVGFINAMIDEMQNRYLIDSERIYATGVSNGGLMSYRLAFELSDRIAAVAATIASLPANNTCSEPVRPISVMIMNGTEDKFILWDGGQGKASGTLLSTRQTVEFWVKHNNCDTIPELHDFPNGTFADGSTVSHEIYDNGAQNTEVVLYRVDGGGHAEPSIIEQYSVLLELIVGRQNHDIEMADEVWDFFKRHTLSGTTSVNHSTDDLPIRTFQLSQNYPNPFNPSTVISYRLSAASDVELGIYNLSGQHIKTLVKSRQSAGRHQILWDGTDDAGKRIASGVYLMTMRAGKFVQAKKMLLLR